MTITVLVSLQLDAGRVQQLADRRQVDATHLLGGIGSYLEARIDSTCRVDGVTGVSVSTTVDADTDVMLVRR